MAAGVIELTETNFKQEVEQSPAPVVVDFWASWCQPCKMLAPVIEEVAKESGGSCKVGKVNVDDHPQLASRFNVAAIPTLVFFKNGREQGRLVGVVSKPEITKQLDDLQ